MLIVHCDPRQCDDLPVQMANPRVGAIALKYCQVPCNFQRARDLSPIDWPQAWLSTS